MPHISCFSSTILNTLDVKGLSEKTQEIQKRYQESLSVLLGSRVDPDSITGSSTTLLNLYTRYRDEYYATRLRNEEILDERQGNLTTLDYEFWFQRNYPILNAQNEGAYTRWLLYGEKDLVESYKAHLDVTSSGVELQEARETLRAAGVISLDRSTTIYPVRFTPSDWYRYLIPR